MKNLYTRLALLATAIIFSLTAVSCDDEWDDWGDDWGQSGSWIDRNLIGTWELYQVNGDIVDDGEENYMQFNRNGYGWYYYYRYGQPIKEKIRFWCDYTNNPSINQVNIIYANGDRSSINYWFSGQRLYMQWYDENYGGNVTYMYRNVDSLPYWN